MLLYQHPVHVSLCALRCDYSSSSVGSASNAIPGRRKLFGESHVDVIVSMYNLAELHRSAGNETEALKIQDQIVDIGEKAAAAMGAKRVDANEASKNGDDEKESRESAERRATTWTPSKSKKQQ